MNLSFIPLETIGAEYKQWAAEVAARDDLSVGVEQRILLSQWVDGLSDRQAGLSAREIVRLCALPGLNLDWFLYVLRHPNPATHHYLMLVYFSLAVFERSNRQIHLKLLTWKKSPTQLENRQFGWRLYLRLVEAGFATFPGDFLMCSPLDRARIVEQTIRQAFLQDYPLVVALTREIAGIQNLG